MNVRTGLVIVLALLAGCSTLSTTGETPTVTPAPVPEPTATEQADRLPPGLTGVAVTDPARLALAHGQATRNTSYTWQSRYVTERRLRNGTLRRERIRIAHVEREQRYDYWTNRRRDSDAQFDYLRNYTEYTDQRGRHARYVDDGTTVYRQYPPRPARRRVGHFASRAIRKYLAVENATVAVTLVDGQRHYAVTGTGYALPSGWNINNYTVNATISPDGFVRSLNASYVRSDGDDRERVTYGFRYTNVGTTTVERPDWVSERWPVTATDETAAP